MAEQHSLTEDYATPYKFNGKELDSETGLYYYGARYYDPRTSIWLSTDPLMEKYPNVNPYVYCVQNPVNFIDPDGMESKGTDDKYKLLRNGKIVFVAHTDDDFDTIYATDRKTGEIDESNSVNISRGILENKTELSTYDTKEKKQVDGYRLEFGNKLVEAKNAFKFFANNSEVEFAYLNLADANNISKNKSNIYTSHEVWKELFSATAALSAVAALREHTHSHPLVGSDAIPSDSDRNFRARLFERLDLLNKEQKKLGKPFYVTPSINIFIMVKKLHIRLVFFTLILVFNSCSEKKH